MPDVCLSGEDAAELADLLHDLREWIDATEAQLTPLLAEHGYDLVGLHVDLDRFTTILTRDPNAWF